MARGGGKKARIKIEDLDTVSATNAKIHFGEFLHRAVYERIPVLVERNGHPMAVLIDIGQYLELKQKAGSAGERTAPAASD